MSSRDFAYWLRGFFEMTSTDSLTKEQVKMIKAHLDMVFSNAVGAGDFSCPVGYSC